MLIQKLPKIQQNKKFYDNLRKGAWKSMAKYGPSSQCRYKIIKNLVKKHFCKTPLLDIGCGIGELTALLKKELKTNIYGSDFSSEAVKIAKKNHPDIKFSEMNLLKSKKSYKKKFNTMIASEVLEHIEDLDLAVKQLNFLLKNKGILILTVPYQQKYWTVHDEFSGHVRRFEKNQLKNALTKRGFVVLEQFSWGNLFYNLYYKILAKTNPKKIMNLNKTTKVKNWGKIIISRLLFFLFQIDSFLKDYKCKTGRRLFVVAKKMQESKF